MALCSDSESNSFSMVMYESDDLVAIASEEVSLNRLFPGETISTTEPLPGTYFTWSK